MTQVEITDAMRAQLNAELKKQFATVVTEIMAETIKALGRVPSGELYARVMEHMTLEEYEVYISVLKFAGLVAENNHELIWIGPADAGRAGDA